MPDSQIVDGPWLCCGSCGRKIGRGELIGKAWVELPCKGCGAYTAFSALPVVHVSDGRGGLLTIANGRR